MRSFVGSLLIVFSCLLKGAGPDQDIEVNIFLTFEDLDQLLTDISDFAEAGHGISIDLKTQIIDFEINGEIHTGRLRKMANQKGFEIVPVPDPDEHRFNPFGILSEINPPHNFEEKLIYLLRLCGIAPEKEKNNLNFQSGDWRYQGSVDTANAGSRIQKIYKLTVVNPDVSELPEDSLPELASSPRPESPPFTPFRKFTDFDALISYFSDLAQKDHRISIDIPTQRIDFEIYDDLYVGRLQKTEEQGFEIVPIVETRESHFEPFGILSAINPADFEEKLLYLLTIGGVNTKMTRGGLTFQMEGFRYHGTIVTKNTNDGQYEIYELQAKELGYYLWSQIQKNLEQIPNHQIIHDEEAGTITIEVGTERLTGNLITIEGIQYLETDTPLKRRSSLDQHEQAAPCCLWRATCAKIGLTLGGLGAAVCFVGAIATATQIPQEETSETNAALADVLRENTQGWIAGLLSSLVVAAGSRALSPKACYCCKS